jgi:O-antigen biosynthesis protein
MIDPSWLPLLGDDRFVPVAVNEDGRARHQNFKFADERDKWAVIAPAEVRLHPEFKEIVLRACLPRPDIDLFYGDEVTLGSGSGDPEIILKPVLDLALLIADDYIGYPLVVRASAMRRLGGLRPAANTAVSYDLVLRATEAGLGIGRITEVLAVHKGARPRQKLMTELQRFALGSRSGRMYSISKEV